MKSMRKQNIKAKTGQIVPPCNYFEVIDKKKQNNQAIRP